MFERYARRVSRPRHDAVTGLTTYSLAALVYRQRANDRRITKRNARFNRVTRRAGFVVPRRWETR